MHKVKRAIIMAAGKGDRMHPVTFDIPKPLVSVNGRRMIDTVIGGLKNNGIDDIVVVTGYLGEKFEALKEEYPGIVIVNNPLYDTCNNISSLYFAREYLDTDVIILDADQMIYNDEILDPGFEKSGYNAVRVQGFTDEWLMQVEDGKVISCSRNGGENGWQLYSISRWSLEDAKILRRDIETEFEKNMNRNIYWDDIPMFVHFDDFSLGIREMKKEDIVEIDSFEELVSADPSYQNYPQAM
ncbi:MAG: phosphocholine cytidylyltransferase family protein [Clostridiales bacterium]|nr:phosphocholine cytidylyltransferase family protein [Clostridiales bacterium]